MAKIRGQPALRHPPPIPHTYFSSNNRGFKYFATFETGGRAQPRVPLRLAAL